MIFKPDLAALILAGEKTVTRRGTSENPRSPWWFEECAIKPGRDYAVCPGRGEFAVARVLVTKVTRGPLGRLTDREARREGFRNSALFERAWWELHGSYEPLRVVWRIAFAVQLDIDRYA